MLRSLTGLSFPSATSCCTRFQKTLRTEAAVFMVIRWSSTRLRLPRTGASSPQTRHLFDVIEPGSSAQAIATIPEFFWELSLGIYLNREAVQVVICDLGDPREPLGGAGNVGRMMLG
jgi:hypothetical protein